MPADKLTIMLGDYPHTKPLKDGTIKSTHAFDFVEVKPANRAFKPMVMEQKFDVCELAIVTYLMAKAHDKPIFILPAAMACHFPHPCLFYNSERGKLTLADLAGKRVGTRSYAQTTPTWLRGIVQNDYGIDWRNWHWVTFEGAHVAEYNDPPGVERAPAGANQSKMLADGELDAAIYGLDRPEDPRLQYLLPDPAAEAAAYQKKHGFVPLNHVVVVTAALAKSNPAAVRDVYRMMREAKTMSGSDLPFSIEALTPALETIILYAYQQELIPRRYSVAELFDDARRVLEA
jgi:4,5-dihydroxyphthalate decarboxylase